MVSSQPANTPGSSGSARERQLVSFWFFKVQPSWWQVDPGTRQQGGEAFHQAVETFRKDMQVHAYSTLGLKSESDFLLWSVGKRPEQFTKFFAALRNTGFGHHIEMGQSYFSMTRRSVYVDKLDPGHQNSRVYIVPAQSKYFFVYPFVKERSWYVMSQEQRQSMMDEHIVIGSKYKSVRIHTTYSFGIDDQEFVVAFETDSPQEFLDLVMELRSSQASQYTLRDTPIFSCVRQDVPNLLQDLGAA
jgi:chlorite dismutase